MRKFSSYIAWFPQARSTLRFAVLIAAAILQACSGRPVYIADDDVTLSDGRDTAVVVASVRSNSSLVKCVTLLWQRYDTENEELTSESTGFIFYPGPKKDTIHMNRCEVDPTNKNYVDVTKERYLAYEVKTGNYILRKFRTFAPVRVTFTSVIKNKSISFNVNKGDIIYIGDFLLEGSEGKAESFFGGENAFYRHDSTKFRIESVNEEAVRAMLSKDYPKLSGPLQVRQPEPFFYKQP